MQAGTKCVRITHNDLVSLVRNIGSLQLPVSMEAAAASDLAWRRPRQDASRRRRYRRRASYERQAAHE